MNFNQLCWNARKFLTRSRAWKITRKRGWTVWMKTGSHQGSWFSTSILCSQGSHILGQLCAICAKGKCDDRVECGGNKMCSKCDAMIHQDLLFDDRKDFLDRFYGHIPPTVNVNEDGKLVQTGWFIYLNVARPLIVVGVFFCSCR